MPPLPTSKPPSSTPSQTALTAAAARAAHLIVDKAPVIFADPLAAPLLGERADELIDYHRAHGDHFVLAGARAEVTCRSRYAERCLAAAVARGVRQYVILGAGLDSFAYARNTAGGVRVFEVDRPASQEWKRERLSRAGIPVPDSVSYLPADLAEDPGGAWYAAGLDPTRPAVFSWLGVTMYLTRDAIAATLAAIGRFPPGTEVIVDHLLPPHLRDPAGQAYADLVAPFAAERGEAWLTFLGPDEMAALLAGHGLDPVEQVGQRGMVEAAMWDRSDALRPVNLSHIARARITPPSG
jgi:methyltransferase (TIGR00027 family)